MRISPEGVYSLDYLQEIVDNSKCGLLITGGEPTVNNHFDDTLKLLNFLKYPFANVETNGLALEKLIERVNLDVFGKVKFIYSPKIFNELDYEKAAYLTPRIIECKSLYLKIVYEPDNQYLTRFIEEISSVYNHPDFRQRIYLMPQGTTRKELLKNAGIVFDACEKYRFNFSSREHIIYGFI
jgi:organic radical activating enzyme